MGIISCLLLILQTGPFCVNGVPLRRVNQAYVIATKTKVDISKLVIPDRLDDDYFRRTKSKPKADSGSGIFADSKQVKISQIVNVYNIVSCCYIM